MSLSYVKSVVKRLCILITNVLSVTDYNKINDLTHSEKILLGK